MFESVFRSCVAIVYCQSWSYTLWTPEEGSCTFLRNVFTAFITTDCSWFLFTLNVCFYFHCFPFYWVRCEKSRSEKIMRAVVLECCYFFFWLLKFHWENRQVFPSTRWKGRLNLVARCAVAQQNSHCVVSVHIHFTSCYVSCTCSIIVLVLQSL